MKQLIIVIKTIIEIKEKDKIEDYLEIDEDIMKGLNNLLPKFQQDFSFEKIFCSNNRITKDDIINFEKNEENIFLNLLKGIEQLNNGKFRINASQILKKEKYSKEKQSVTTKESETINNSDKNNNTSKSIKIKSYCGKCFQYFENGPFSKKCRDHLKKKCNIISCQKNK